MGTYAFLKIIGPTVIYLGAWIAILSSISGRIILGLVFLIPLFPLHNIYEKIFDFPFGDNINDILIVSMLVGWMVSKSKNKEPIFISSPLNFFFIIYIFYTYFSLWRGSIFLGESIPIDPANPRVQLWKNYILFPIIFFITINNINNKDELLKVLIVICITIAVMDFYHIRSVDEMTSWVARAKFKGTLYLGANEVASFYATYTFVLLGLWIFKPPEIKFYKALTLLIGCNYFLVLFLFSRGAYAAVIVTFLFIAVHRKPLLLAPILFILISWQWILPEQVVERLTFSENEGALDQSAALRLVYWKISWNYFLDHPIIGIGFNTILYVVRHDTHNIWLRTLAEQGIIGGGFLLAIFIFSLRRSWQLYKNTCDPFYKGIGYGFFCCALACFISNFFGDRWTHLELGAFFWVFLGIIERGNFLISKS